MWMLTGIIMLLFFSNPFIIKALVGSHEANSVELKTGQTYPAGIVLGGFAGYNSKDKRGYFNASSDRFIQAVLLYKKAQIRKIIVAAGNGYLTDQNFVEADFAKQQLINIGIPAGDIYTDGLSKNTEQNAINSKKIIDSLKLHGPFVLITSAFHMPRAAMLFRKKGMDIIPYPCDFISKQVSNNFVEDYIFPSSGALQSWDVYIKEMLGIIVYKLTGKA
jgi:uncharacterized SAM-binding protein YcdF (DUF218 family)